MKNEKAIVCRHGHLGALELEVQVDKPISLKLFANMRRRLLRREEGTFFTDIIFTPDSGFISATLGIYVREHQHVRVLGIFRSEIERLMGDLYCIDCSLLHQPLPLRKPISARKGK